MDESIEQQLYGQKRIYHQPIVRYFYRQRLVQLLNAVPPKSGHQVLDIGSEHGILLYKLSKAFPGIHLTGLDKNGAALSKTQALFQADATLREINFIEGDFLTEDFGDKQYDRIFATSVLEHIRPIEAVAPIIAKLLKPNGYFVVLSPHETWFYNLLRKLFGYTKPSDHYHTSQKITEVLSKHLCLIGTHYYPPIARLYKIDIFNKGLST